jgi:hypothetical protein
MLNSEWFEMEFGAWCFPDLFRPRANVPDVIILLSQQLLRSLYLPILPDGHQSHTQTTLIVRLCQEMESVAKTSFFPMLYF